ncbi:MAG: DUF72 domain-containing protein [Oligoflexus sp.]
MHFGRVTNSPEQELSLPQDRRRTQSFLQLQHQGRGELLVGAPIWSCKEWQGSFYPTDYQAGAYLEYYSRIFPCVEVNSTFYGLPAISQIHYWQRQVPGNFRFCPKLSKSLSHQPGRTDIVDELTTFCRHVEAFAENLGLCFIQFPENFSWKERDLLARLLKHLPQTLRWAVEFRHPSWFHDHMLHDELINFLYRQNIATIISDTPGRRDALHFSLSQDQVMIRFLGQFPSPSDNHRLKAWHRRLSKWQDLGMDRIYFFIHQARHVTIPETCLYMQRLVTYGL